LECRLSRDQRVEDSSKQSQVAFDGVVVAATRRAKRVLETGHPPVSYVPLEDVRLEYLNRTDAWSRAARVGRGDAFFLSGEPSGRLLLLTLEDAFEWIVALEERVAELEQ